MSGSADLHKAIVSAWDAALDEKFTQYWPSSKVSEFTVLRDAEAQAGHPMPYAIFAFQAPSVISRMSGLPGDSQPNRQQIRNVPVSFSIHTRYFSAVGQKSAKQISIELVDAVMARFGGHPVEEPTQLVLDNGGVLQLQYQNDYGARTGDDEHSWMVNYIALVDVPVAQ